MEEKDPVIERRAQAISGGLDKTSEYRIKGYDMALEMRATKNGANQRERARMQKKYGKSHPRIQKLDQAIGQNAYTAKAIQVQKERAQNTVPTQAQNAYQVSGILTNQRGTPIPDLTISLFNREGVWEKDLGHTCTNKNGSFHLQVTDEKLIKLFEGQAFSVTVSNSKSEVLLNDKNLVKITRDGSDVRHLILDGEDYCEEPPISPNDPKQTDGGYTTTG